MGTYRTIRCEHGVTETIQAMGDLPRFDEALAGLSEAFARHPERYPVEGPLGLRVAAFTFYDGAPPVRVAFQVTEDEIRVIAVEIDAMQLFEEPI